MGRVKKEFNSDGVFQTRFRDLYSNTGITQSTLAEALDVSRPTVAGWLLGKNLPDIISLEKIARYFNVSADYLLGINDTASPDVSVKAAVAYTGLSQEAVEMLHKGLVSDVRDGAEFFKAIRKNDLNMTSLLIQNSSFEKMIDHLISVFKAAYAEKIMAIVNNNYSDDRAVLLDNLIYIRYKYCFPPLDEDAEKILKEAYDDYLFIRARQTEMELMGENERHQFLADKAFSNFIDHVVKGAQEKAENDFHKKPNERT